MECHAQYTATLLDLGESVGEILHFQERFQAFKGDLLSPAAVCHDLHVGCGRRCLEN
jgi:hypothetical protein